MENRIICPKCGGENTEHIRSGKTPGYRIDLEVHPFLYRCMDCGEVFPAPNSTDEL